MVSPVKPTTQNKIPNAMWVVLGFGIAVLTLVIFINLLTSKQTNPSIAAMRLEPLATWVPDEIVGTERRTEHSPETGWFKPDYDTWIERRITVRQGTSRQVFEEALTIAKQTGWTIDYQSENSFYAKRGSNGRNATYLSVFLLGPPQSAITLKLKY